MIFIFGLAQILLAIPGAIIAIVLHEYTKSIVNNKLGQEMYDNSGIFPIDSKGSKRNGISLSFGRYIDILGLIFKVFFGFGWANPVKIQPFHFSNRKRSLLLLFLAPFLVNIIVGAAATIAAHLYFLNVLASSPSPSPTNIYIYMGISNIATLNLSFALFNIIPIFPLSGVLWLSAIKPVWAAKISQNERLLQILLAFFILLGGASHVFSPLVQGLMRVL